MNKYCKLLHKLKRKKANWISHILRRNCLLKLVIEGKIEGRILTMGRRGKRLKELLDDLEKNGVFTAVILSRRIDMHDRIQN
jgi:hypothetical protein